MNKEKNNTGILQSRIFQISFCILILAIVFIIVFQPENFAISFVKGIIVSSISLIVINIPTKSQKNGAKDYKGGFVKFKEIFEYDVESKELQKEKQALLKENQQIEEILNEWDGFEFLNGTGLKDTPKSIIKMEIMDMLSVAKTGFAPYAFRNKYLRMINDYFSTSKTVHTRISERMDWSPNSEVINKNFVLRIKKQEPVDKLIREGVRLFNETYIKNTLTPTVVRSVINDLERDNFISTPIDRQVAKFLYALLPHEPPILNHTACTEEYVLDILPNQSTTEKYIELLKKHKEIISYFDKVFTISFDDESKKFGPDAYHPPIYDKISCNFSKDIEAKGEENYKTIDNIIILKAEPKENYTYGGYTPPKAQSKQAVATPKAQSKQAVATPKAQTKQSVATPRAQTKQSVTTPRAEVKQSVATPRAEVKQSVATPKAQAKQAVATPRSEVKQAVPTQKEELNAKESKEEQHSWEKYISFNLKSTKEIDRILKEKYNIDNYVGISTRKEAERIFRPSESERKNLINNKLKSIQIVLSEEFISNKNIKQSAVDIIEKILNKLKSNPNDTELQLLLYYVSKKYNLSIDDIISDINDNPDINVVIYLDLMPLIELEYKTVYKTVHNFDIFEISIKTDESSYYNENGIISLYYRLKNNNINVEELINIYGNKYKEKIDMISEISSDKIEMRKNDYKVLELKLDLNENIINDYLDIYGNSLEASDEDFDFIQKTKNILFDVYRLNTRPAYSIDKYLYDKYKSENKNEFDNYDDSQETTPDLLEDKEKNNYGLSNEEEERLSYLYSKPTDQYSEKEEEELQLLKSKTIHTSNDDKSTQNLTRNFKLRNPKISLIPAITGKEDEKTMAFIKNLVKLEYDFYRKTTYSNIMNEMNDIHLRLLVHYMTNLDRIEVINSLDDKCLNTVNQVGKKIEEMKEEIERMREVSKDVEILKKIEAESKELRGKKIEAEAKLSALEKEYKELQKNKDTGETKFKLNRLEQEVANYEEELKTTKNNLAVEINKNSDLIAELSSTTRSLDTNINKVSERDAEIKDLNTSISKYREDIKNLKSDIQLNEMVIRNFKLKEKRMEEISDNYSSLRIHLRDKYIQINKIISEVEKAINKSNEVNKSNYIKQMLEQNIIIKSIDKISRDIASVKSISEDMNMLNKIVSKNYKYLNDHNSKNVITMSKNYKYIVDKLNPLFISNGSGFRYLKEHINKLVSEKKILEESVKSVDLLKIAKYTEEYREAQEIDINNIIRQRVRLFEIDKELYHQLQIVNRFNLFTETIFKNMKRIDTSAIEKNISNPMKAFLEEYIQLANKYNQYAGKYVAKDEANTVLVSKNKILERKLAEVMNQNRVVNYIKQEAKSMDVLKLLEEERVRLIQVLEEKEREYSTMSVDMTNLETELSKQIEKNNELHESIVSLNIELDKVKAKFQLELEKSIDEHRAEMHLELDDIIKALGFEKEINTNWNFDNSSYGNIKKKQLFVISSIRELLDKNKTMKEAMEDIEVEKSNLTWLREEYDKSQLIIQRLKKELSKYDNTITESIQYNDILDDYTNKIIDENDKLKRKMVDIEDIRNKESEELNDLRKRLELINMNYSENKEKINDVNNSNITIGNAGSNSKEVSRLIQKLHGIINIINRPKWVDVAVLEKEILQSISVKGANRIMIHVFLSNVFSKEGIKELEKIIINKYYFNSPGDNDVIVIFKELFSMIDKDILTQYGINLIMNYLSIDSDTEEISNDDMFINEIHLYLSKLAQRKNKFLKDLVGEAEDDEEYLSDEEAYMSDEEQYNTKKKNLYEMDDVGKDNNTAADNKVKIEEILQKTQDDIPVYFEEYNDNSFSYGDYMTIVMFKLGFMDMQSKEMKDRFPNGKVPIPATSILNSTKFVINALASSIAYINGYSYSNNMFIINKEDKGIKNYNGRLVREILKDEEIKKDNEDNKQSVEGQIDFSVLLKHSTQYDPFNIEKIFDTKKFANLLFSTPEFNGDVADTILFNCLDNIKYYIAQKESIAYTTDKIEELEIDVQKMIDDYEVKIIGRIEDMNSYISKIIDQIKQSLSFTSNDKITYNSNKRRLEELNSKLITYENILKEANDMEDLKKIKDTEIQIRDIKKQIAGKTRILKQIDQSNFSLYNKNLEEIMSDYVPTYDEWLKQNPNGSEDRYNKVRREIREVKKLSPIEKQLYVFSMFVESKVKDLRKGQEESKNIPDNLNIDIETVSRNIKEVKRLLGDNNADIVNIAMSMDTLITEAKKYKEMKMVNDNKIKEITKKLEKNNKTINDYETEINIKNKELQALKSSLEKIEENAYIKEKNKNEAITKANTLAQEKDKYYNIIQSYKQSIDDLNTEINATYEKNNKLSEIIEKIKTSEKGVVVEALRQNESNVVEDLNNFIEKLSSDAGSLIKVGAIKDLSQHINEGKLTVFSRKFFAMERKEKEYNEIIQLFNNFMENLSSPKSNKLVGIAFRQKMENHVDIEKMNAFTRRFFGLERTEESYNKLISFLENLDEKNKEIIKKLTAYAKDIVITNAVIDELNKGKQLNEFKNSKSLSEEKNALAERLNDSIIKYNSIQQMLTEYSSNIVAEVEGLDIIHLKTKEIKSNLEDSYAKYSNLENQMNKYRNQANALSAQMSKIKEINKYITSKLEKANNSALEMEKIIRELQISNRTPNKEVNDTVNSIISKYIDYFTKYNSDIQIIIQTMNSLENKWKEKLINDRDYANENKKMERKILELVDENKNLKNQLSINEKKILNNKVRKEEDLQTIQILLEIFNPSNRTDYNIIQRLQKINDKIDVSNIMDYIISKKEMSLEIIKAMKYVSSDWKKFGLNNSAFLSKAKSELDNIISLCEKYIINLTDIKDGVMKNKDIKYKNIELLKKIKDMESDFLITANEYKEKIALLEEKRDKLYDETENNKKNNQELEFLYNILEAIKQKVEDNRNQVSDISINVDELAKRSNILSKNFITNKNTVQEIYEVIVKSIDELNNKNTSAVVENKSISEEIDRLNKEIQSKNTEMQKMKQISDSVVSKEIVNNEEYEKMKEEKIKIEQELNEYKEIIEDYKIENERLLEFNKNIILEANISSEAIDKINNISKGYTKDIISYSIELNSIVDYVRNIKQKHLESLNQILRMKKQIIVEQAIKEKYIKEYNAIFKTLRIANEEIEKYINDRSKNISYEKLRYSIMALSELNTKISEMESMVSHSFKQIEDLQKTAITSIDSIYNSIRAINQLSLRADSMINSVRSNNSSIVELEILKKLNNNPQTNLYEYIDKNIQDVIIKQTKKNKLMTIETNSIINTVNNISLNKPNYIISKDKTNTYNEYNSISEKIDNTPQTQSKENIKIVYVSEPIYIPLDTNPVIVKPNKIRKKIEEERYKEFHKYIKTLSTIK